MSAFLSVAFGILAIVGLGVAAVAWWAAARSRRSRLVLLAMGFTAIACAGIATAWILWRGADAELALTVQSLSVAVGLVLVYLAAVKQ